MADRRFLHAAAIMGVAAAITACAGGSSTTTSGAATIPIPTSETPAATASATASPTSKITITAPKGATMGGYAETQLTASAGVPLQIVFHNDDPGIQHNVQVFAGTTTTGTPLWAPTGNASITGVDTVTYRLPPLPAGTYTFNCYVHPATMFGTLTVG